ARWTRPAWIGFAAVCAYILANGLITEQAEAQVRTLLREQGVDDALVVASPVPLAFWRRDIFWRDGVRYGSGTYALGRGGAAGAGAPTGMDDARLRLCAQASPAARAFLFWARMPVATREGDAFVVRDQRFMQSFAKDRFMVRVEAPKPAGPDEQAACGGMTSRERQLSGCGICGTETQ